MNHSVRFWSLGRYYVVPDMDKDTAFALWDILTINGVRAELWQAGSKIRG